MADLRKYPNPLRLFTQTRDQWFTSLVTSYDIPMHIFSAVRDTQLGQLMFAIESARMRRKRSGEDPGPGLLEGDNATMFIPLFGLVKQFQELVNHDDIELEVEALYNQLLSDELMTQLDDLHKTGQEWFTPMSINRLDKLIIACTDIMHKGIIQPLCDILEIKDEVSLRDKLTELDEGFTQTFFQMYNPERVEAIKHGKFQEESINEEQVRVFTLSDEEERLSFNQYHGNVNLLYSFLLELKRLVSDPSSYNFKFDMLEPLLTMEMLIMFPTPDTSRLPLVKQHLERFKGNAATPRVFLDLISTTYQAFSRIEEANSRMVRKLFNTLEKTMKSDARKFWKQIETSSQPKDSDKVIAVMWSHLRAIQTQAQYREQQMGQQGHSQSHAVTVRLEHIFWVQGRSYYELEDYTTPIQFWSAYAAIANKQVRKKEDSLDLFYELDQLLKGTRVLTNKKFQAKLDANQSDQYSLLQRILSYGLESRDTDSHSMIDSYLKILETLLDKIDPDNMHDNFDLDQEKQVISDIGKHMQNTLQAQST